MFFLLGAYYVVIFTVVVVVNCVRLIVDYHSRWRESWVHSVGWDCCTLHSFVHYWWNNGGLSLIVVLMGPPPQCSRYIWLIGVFVIILFFGLIHCSLV